MEAMKDEAQQFEREIRLLQQELQEKQQKLSAYRVGTEDYQRIQREIAELAGSIQAQTQLKGEEFRQREAGIYFDVYQEVSGVIAQFAERNGIQLVLRFNSEDADPKDPQSVLREVNRPIIYQHRLNITYDIQQILIQQAAARSSGGAPLR